jgi:NADH-quinone oxidoreductase subunit J
MTTAVEYFFLIIALIMMACSLAVIFTKSSIHSIIFLVLSFLMSSGFLLILECEFFALLFLIIYVGAIAVLFLFVIMLLDLKILPRNNPTNLKYTVFGIFVGLNFFYFVNQTLNDYYVSNLYDGVVLSTYTYINYFNEDDISEIAVIGQILYTQYVLQFLIAGVLLTLSVIGVCVLTLNPKVLKQKKYSPIVV